MSTKSETAYAQLGKHNAPRSTVLAGCVQGVEIHSDNNNTLEGTYSSFTNPQGAKQSLVFVCLLGAWHHVLKFHVARCGGTGESFCNSKVA